MVALAVAAFGVLGAVVVFVLEQRTSRREKLREKFGTALADIYRWAELPYRVRRRSPAETARFDLAEQISDLQERVGHHTAWLHVESTEVHKAFVQLSEVTRARVAPQLRNAWDSSPIQADADMSIGDLGIDIADIAATYAAAVRQHLCWYVFKFWQ